MFPAVLFSAVQCSAIYPWHGGPWEPAGSRSSLRPLSIEGEATKQSSGEMSREDAKVCLGGRRMGRALAKPIMFQRRQSLMGFASLYPSYCSVIESAARPGHESDV